MRIYVEVGKASSLKVGDLIAKQSVGSINGGITTVVVVDSEMVVLRQFSDAEFISQQTARSLRSIADEIMEIASKLSQ